MYQLKKLVFAVLITFLVFATGCSGKKEENKMKIGLLPIVDALPFIVAAEKGYYQAEGINVELVDFPSALERDSALQAQVIDGTLGDVLSVASLNQGGTPTSIVSLGLGETGQEGRFAILAAPNSGINRPEQLKNVPVAISLNSIIEYVTDNMLLEQGLKPEEIKKESIPKIPVRFEMLMQGQIKAACLPDPLAALAESKGARLIVDDTALNLSQTVIYFRNDYIEKNSKNITKFLRAYGKAVKDINENPDAYRSLLVEKLKVPKEALEVYKVDHFPSPQLPEKTNVEKVVQWMVAKGLLKQPLTYDEITRAGLFPAN